MYVVKTTNCKLPLRAVKSLTPEPNNTPKVDELEIVGNYIYTMRAREESRHLQDVIEELPDEIDAKPDING
jgi:hypothetical protein